MHHFRVILNGVKKLKSIHVDVNGSFALLRMTWPA